MYFVLNSDIQITQGVARSCLIDFRTSIIKPIPNEVGRALSNRIVAYSTLSDDEKEFYDYLIQQEVGLLVESQDEAKLFEPLSEEFYYPAIISNSIIELRNNNTERLNLILPQLFNLGCRYTEVRLIGFFEYSEIISVLNKLDEFGVEGILLCLNYHPNLKAEVYKDFNQFPNLAVSLKIFNCADEEVRNEITTLNI